MGNILMEVLLIDADYIKQNSTISDNLLDKYLNPCISKSQYMELQSLIGTKLAVKICEMVRDETIENTPYEVLLTDYIQPYLMQLTQAELLVSNYAKMRNGGNLQYLDTNQSNITIEDMWKLHSHYNNNAAFLANRLTDFIIANRKDYPEYCRVSDCSEMHAHVDSSLNSGWVL